MGGVLLTDVNALCRETSSSNTLVCCYMTMTGSMFINFLGSADRPDIRDLTRHIIPQIHAEKWEDLGVQLLSGNTAELSHIKEDATTTHKRFTVLFEKWLRECDAKWDGLINALEKVQLNYLAQKLREMLKKAPGIFMLWDIILWVGELKSVLLFP